MAKTEAITQKRLKEILHYDPNTGAFTWPVSPRNSVKAGSIAGYLTNKGYRRIQVFGRRHYAQQLAFLYMTGSWPSKQIDHRNSIRADNRWDNLRPATHGQNQRNRIPSGRSRFNGVCWHKRSQGWQAQARLNGKQHYLGLHDTEEAAAAAYAAFAAEHFPEFARFI